MVGAVLARHLVRLAPDHDFAGRSLRDVLEAHISLLKNHIQNVPQGTAVEPSGCYNDGDLYWFPTAFIVLTTEDFENTGPLLVYADSHNESTECPLDMFYFRVENATSMLSSLRLGDSTCADAKEVYAINNTEPA